MTKIKRPNFKSYNKTPLNSVIGNVNSITYNINYERLLFIILNIFEYRDLPKGMNARKLELDLHTTGTASILKRFVDNIPINIINLRVNSNGNINYYDLPIDLYCYSYDIHETRRTYFDELIDEAQVKKDKMAILCFNNFFGTSSLEKISYYAYKLANIERISDVNLNLQRAMGIIGCTNENTRLSIENIINDWNNNKIINITTDEIMDDVKTMQFDVPFIGDKLMDMKNRIFNEFLTDFGINNIQINKKERLTENESQVNNEVVNINLQNYYDTRLTFIRQMNECFGTNSGVYVNSDLENIIKNTRTSIVGDDKYE